MPGWIWIALGVVVAAAEMVASGAYLLWIGLAAIVVGIVLLLQPALSLEAQLALFAALAVLAAFIGQLVYRRLAAADSDRPSLNRRAEQLVGRGAVLEQPIVDGIGKIRIDDTTWRVEGPDLAAGTHVRIVGVADSTLRVVAAG
jgi:hypothetical protein